MRILESQTFSRRFRQLLDQIRADNLTMDEITAEVEAAQQIRYEAK